MTKKVVSYFRKIVGVTKKDPEATVNIKPQNFQFSPRDVHSLTPFGEKYAAGHRKQRG